VERCPFDSAPQIVSKAEVTIAWIMGGDSELLELWDEEGRYEEWHGKVEDLATRILG
jgi:hypothetical protein